jgi:predicted flap endonuclease-1-like 5' DNA nuclease
MWFLLVKIFILLCLAALMGAAFAWWWMRRKFVDVTESHTELNRQVDAFLAQGKALTREDVEYSLKMALASYRPPQPDFMPVEQKLVDLERAVSAPDQNVAALHERLVGVEQSVSAISAAIASMRTVHLEAIDQHLRGVSARIDNLRMPDIESVNTRLTALTSHVSDSRLPELRAAIEPRLQHLELLISEIQLPEINLGPVHSGIAAIQVAVENLELPAPDLAPLQQRIEELSVRPELQHLCSEIEALSVAAKSREPDLDIVLQRVSALEMAVRDVQIPEPDLAPIVERLALLEARLAAGPSSETLIGTLAGIESDLDVLSRRPVDLEPVYSQLGALDASLAAIRTELRGQNRTESLERRLVALQDAVLNAPQPDYTRIDLALRSIESTFDLGALEDRLTAIEYGLTAVHHMLRNRSEPPRAELEPRIRPEPAATFEPRPVPRPARIVPAPPPEPPPRPARRLDPITLARRVDDEANLLTHAAFGTSDDLELIVGVGPMLTELLHEVGVFYFWQIAEWSSADVEYVDGKLLHFKGRIERDDWVGQSRQLALLPTSAKRPEAD